MDALYLDESGDFEGRIREGNSVFIGGFLTQSAPARVHAALLSIREDLHVDEELAPLHDVEPYELTGHEVRQRLKGREAPERFRALFLRRLLELEDVRLVSTHFVRDAPAGLDALKNDRGINRFLRMWQTTVRNATLYQPWRGSSALVVNTASRRLRSGQINKGNRALLGTDVAPGDLRVFSRDRLASVLVGVIEGRRGGPYARQLQYAQVSPSFHSLSWTTLLEQPRHAGIVLADLVCHCIRHADLRDTPVRWLRIGYSPRWDLEWERLVERLGPSPTPIKRLCDLLDRSLSDDVDRWAHGAAAEMLTTLLADARGSPELRAAFMDAARESTRVGGLGKGPCERIFGPNGLDRAPTTDISLAEALTRTCWQVRSGRDAGGDADLDVRLLPQLARDLDSLFTQGESVLDLASAHLDALDVLRAVRVSRGLADLTRSHVQAARQRDPEARWGFHGRACLGLAASLTWRQADGDLAEATTIVREARAHLQAADLADEWARSAATLAASSADDALASDALNGLLGTARPDEIARRLREQGFDPIPPLLRLRSLAAVTRLAVVGQGALAQELRCALSEPACWHHLKANVRGASSAGLYTRHLLELAPPDLIEADEKCLFDLACRSADEPDVRVTELARAFTKLAHAQRLFRHGRPNAPEAATAGLRALLRPYRRGDCVVPSTWAPERPDAWFGDLAEPADLDAAEVGRVLNRVRWDWR